MTLGDVPDPGHHPHPPEGHATNRLDNRVESEANRQPYFDLQPADPQIARSTDDHGAEDRIAPALRPRPAGEGI